MYVSVSENIASKSHTFLGRDDVFLFKPVAFSMWWSRALLKKVNVEVNIKTYHVTYYVILILKVTILQLPSL